MSWWFSGCCRGVCPVFSDDFDAGASTDLGSGWTEGLGDWERINPNGGGVLQENGTLGAIVLTTAQTATNEQAVATLIYPNVGDMHRVVCNAVDLNNCHFVEIEQKAAETAIRFYRRTEGVNELLRPEDSLDKLETPSGVGICIDRTSFTVSFTPTPADGFAYVCTPDLFADGKKAGLGNGSTSTLWFDDFGLSNFYGKDAIRDSFICCAQQCFCEEGGRRYCIPRVLLVTITAWGGCASLDGLTFLITYVPSRGQWRSAGDGSAIPCMDTWWIFKCGDSPCDELVGEQFGISNMLGAGYQCGAMSPRCIDYDQAATSAVCDPFVVVFPAVSYVAFDPPIGCECCDDEVAGGLFVTVTEPPPE